MIDKTLCDEAVNIVTGARQKAYDKPESNFARIALAWEAITDRAYTASEVALMFVALKIVRESHQHQRDNIVDGIGYLLCADEVTPEAESVPAPAYDERSGGLQDYPTPCTYVYPSGFVCSAPHPNNYHVTVVRSSLPTPPLVNCIDGCNKGCKEANPEMHTIHRRQQVYGGR